MKVHLDSVLGVKDLFNFPSQVAKTLFNDECLKPCPRCQHPARCHSVKGEGICSRADCGFQFCTACLCAFHGSRECGSQSAGRRKDKLLPGSAQSKRNIRRLWARQFFPLTISCFFLFFLGFKMNRRLICNQYMKTTSVLISVSLSLSLYCSYLSFFRRCSYSCVFNCVWCFASSPVIELCCWCTFPRTVINSM